MSSLKIPAAPFFHISPLSFKGEGGGRMKNKTIHSLPSSHSPLLAYSPLERECTRGVQQKQQTEIELLFRSELAVIFRKSDRLYVELQHHKVTPDPPPPRKLFLFQPISLQPMTHHKVCGDVTPYYQPPCSDLEFDLWLIDLIQSNDPHQSAPVKV